VFSHGETQMSGRWLENCGEGSSGTSALLTELPIGLECLPMLSAHIVYRIRTGDFQSPGRGSIPRVGTMHDLKEDTLKYYLADWIRIHCEELEGLYAEYQHQYPDDTSSFKTFCGFWYYSFRWDLQEEKRREKLLQEGLLSLDEYYSKCKKLR
jgi:hypothetical protein